MANIAMLHAWGLWSSTLLAVISADSMESDSADPGAKPTHDVVGSVWGCFFYFSFFSPDFGRCQIMYKLHYRLCSQVFLVTTCRFGHSAWCSMVLPMGS